jgi:predicted HAD superfamily phosphohydrolase YqeG
MPRRVPMLAALDLDELETLVAAAPDPLVMIFDADNTIVPQGIPFDQFRVEVTAAVERFEALPTVARVIVLTNGPDRGVPHMLYRGNKPWTTRRRLGLTSDHRSIWVIGDQVLTDGLLAWRLGATFVHLVVDEESEDSRQATMRRVGRRVADVFFEK